MFKVGAREFPDDAGYCLVGILNCTPDSFYDGGRYNDLEPLKRRIDRIVSEGGKILDVGGESSRPGAEPVSPEEEIERVLPAISYTRRNYPDLPISIDTVKSQVAAAAIDAGASIVNDISGLSMDPEMGALVVDRQVSVVINHMQGRPRDMQADPRYENVVEEVYEFLTDRARQLVESGLPAEKIMIDPGIGFGKTLGHNLALLHNLDRFTRSGYEVMLGTSRKSFIDRIIPSPPAARLPGTLVSGIEGLRKGVRFFRVHDVGEHRQAFEVWRAVTDRGGGSL